MTDTLNTKAQDVISKLPETMQPAAMRLAEMALIQGTDRVDAMIDKIIDGTAYDWLCETMTVDEMTAELKRLNDKLVEMNKEDATVLQLKREAAKELIQAGLTIAIQAMMK